MPYELLEAFNGIWIWPENGNIRLWTQNETYLFEDVKPRHETERLLIEGREIGKQIQLRNSIYPEELGYTLEKLINKHEKTTLFIYDKLKHHQKESKDDETLKRDNNLISKLNTIPFEWLYIHEKPLMGHLSVCRHNHFYLDTIDAIRSQIINKVDTSYPTYPIDPEKKSLLVDIWHTNKLDKAQNRNPSEHPLSGLGLKKYIRKKGIEDTHDFFRTIQPSFYSSLIIFGHGNEKENNEAFPLEDEEGNPWKIPTDNGLPPLVILLACGSNAGHLVRYGKILLDHGARTVIAPFGQLNANESRLFLDFFLDKWKEGVPVNEILLEAQHLEHLDTNGWGAKRLVIIGHPGLRKSKTAELEELTNSELVEISKYVADTDASKAAAIVANRITLNSFKQGFGLEGAEENLHKLYGADSSEDLLKHLKQLFEIYDKVPNEFLGNLTKTWLYPLLANGAEQHNKARMNYYEKFRQELTNISGFGSPIVYNYWSRVHYREGRYCESLKDLITGLLKIWPIMTVDVSYAMLARNLANTLLDYNLPDTSYKIAAQLQHDLTSNFSNDWRDFSKFLLIDTQARIEMKKGFLDGEKGWLSALNLFESKRFEAINKFNHDGNRELASLLYISAWVNPGSKQTNQHANEIRALVKNSSEFNKLLIEGKGNDDSRYLLRAYSAFIWRNFTEKLETANQDLKVINKIIPTLSDLVTSSHHDEDFGPIGYALGYLHLIKKNKGDIFNSIPEWNIVRQKLIKDRYYLEVSVFDSLLGFNKKVNESLNFYISDRDECFQQLPELISNTNLDVQYYNIFSSLTKEADQRKNIEKETLTQKNPPSVTELLENGLIPL